MTLTGPFYHGSYEYFPIGSRLSGRGAEYHEEWSLLGHYEALHHHKPEDCLAHRDAVFMCSEIWDIHRCGGATETVALLKPEGPVTRHDLEWSNAIIMLLNEGRGLDDPDVRDACLAYWTGEATGDPLWEFLTPAARVLAVADWDDPDAEEILGEFWEGTIEAAPAP
ncbi:hypothetical protein ACEUZ9_000305 [Paracoccus litorisediminis]|uniref:hypothetical protein n=1 Tax=Paracoccus litorisediminis TaxID=2006130 RepID=UPI003732B0C1